MKILLPVDGSERGLESVHLALRLIRGGLGAHIVLANVQSPPSLYEVVVAHDAEVIREVSDAAAAHALEAARALLRAAGVAHDDEVGVGAAAQVLAEIAERHGCEMVILGSHRSGATGGAAMGDVARGLVGDGRWAVLIAAAGDAADGRQ